MGVRRKGLVGVFGAGEMDRRWKFVCVCVCLYVSVGVCALEAEWGRGEGKVEEVEMVFSGGRGR